MLKEYSREQTSHCHTGSVVVFDPGKPPQLFYQVSFGQLPRLQALWGRGKETEFLHRVNKSGLNLSGGFINTNNIVKIAGYCRYEKYFYMADWERVRVCCNYR